MRNVAFISKAVCGWGAALLLASCNCVSPPAVDSPSAAEAEAGVRQMALSIARDVASMSVETGPRRRDAFG